MTPMRLTPRETALLDALRPGRVVPFGDLIKLTQAAATDPDASLQKLASELRGKLRQARKRLRVVLVPHVGYRLALVPRHPDARPALAACMDVSSNFPGDPPAAGDFCSSDPLLMRLPARADASENNRARIRPMIAEISSIHAPSQIIRR